MKRLIVLGVGGLLAACNQETGGGVPAAPDPLEISDSTDVVAEAAPNADRVEPTQGQEPQTPGVGDASLNDCAAMPGATARLGCYDELAIERGYRPPQTAVGQSGKWVVSETTNPMDDTRQVTLILPAELTSTVSRMGDRPIFVARCMSNTTEAYINWNDYLGDDSSSVYSDWKNVTIRIGDEAAIQQRWGVSTDSRATFAPGWAGSLLRQMAGANTLVARTTPYNASPVTAIFDTTGMAEALVPLMETCGWTLNGVGEN